MNYKYAASLKINNFFIFSCMFGKEFFIKYTYLIKNLPIISTLDFAEVVPKEFDA